MEGRRVEERGWGVQGTGKVRETLLVTVRQLYKLNKKLHYSCAVRV